MTRPRLTPSRAARESFPTGAKVLLAVSGGMDSVSLLHAVQALRVELSLTLGVAHVDHGLRKESGIDSDFVENLATGYNLPFFKRALTPQLGVNMEGWGRKERYSFFKEVCEASDFDSVATAHTADDLAETFLIRLVSNKELNTISRYDSNRKVLRPFLDVSREAILLYVREQGLSFREDPSNTDTARLRNRVRHELIPQLSARFDPRIKEVISNRAASVAEDSEALYSMAKSLLNKVTAQYGTREWMRAFRTELECANHAVAWRAVELLFKKKLGFNLGRKRAVSALELFVGEKVGIELPGGLSIRKHSGGVIEFPRK